MRVVASVNPKPAEGAGATAVATRRRLKSSVAAAGACLRAWLIASVGWGVAPTAWGQSGCDVYALLGDAASAFGDRDWNAIHNAARDALECDPMSGEARRWLCQEAEWRGDYEEQATCAEQGVEVANSVDDEDTVRALTESLLRARAMLALRSDRTSVVRGALDAVERGWRTRNAGQSEWLQQRELELVARDCLVSGPATACQEEVWAVTRGSDSLSDGQLGLPAFHDTPSRAAELNAWMRLGEALEVGRLDEARAILKSQRTVSFAGHGELRANVPTVKLRVSVPPAPRFVRAGGDALILVGGVAAVAGELGAWRAVEAHCAGGSAGDLLCVESVRPKLKQAQWVAGTGIGLVAAGAVLSVWGAWPADGRGALGVRVGEEGTMMVVVGVAW